MSKLNIIIKRVGEPMQLRSIENDLRQMQAIVEGPIELLRLGHEICLICNEEGKLRVLKPNFAMPQDIIVGNVFFTKALADSFVDLSYQDAYKIQNWLQQWDLEQTKN